MSQGELNLRDLQKLIATVVARRQNHNAGHAERISGGLAEMTMPSTDVTMGRLEDQIAWYDNKSNLNQRVFRWLKMVEIGGAAFVPFSAGIGMPALVTGGLGVLITVLEGLQHLNQYQHNWITYRSTCESLRHEKYLYLAQAGPYATAADPHTLLAERVESLVSQEHAKWAAGQEQATRRKGVG